MVDNFKPIREKLLDFQKPEDFYVFHVIQRAKDKRADGTLRPGDTRDEGQRLIKTWYVDSREYFERKVDAMKEVAEANRARLYFMPQVRSKLTVNRVLAKAIIDAIDETGLRYDHLIRTAVCGCHASRDKRWILDIDDEMFEKLPGVEDPHAEARKFAMDVVTVDIFSWASEQNPFHPPYLEKLYETRNGWGVVTKPFDVRILQVLNEEESPSQPAMLGHEISHHTKDYCKKMGLKFKTDDILKKDGMMLAYCNF